MWMALVCIEEEVKNREWKRWKEEREENVEMKRRSGGREDMRCEGPCSSKTNVINR